MVNNKRHAKRKNAAGKKKWYRTTDEERRKILMMYIAGHRQNFIASLLEIPTTTVRNIVLGYATKPRAAAKDIARLMPKDVAYAIMKICGEYYPDGIPKMVSSMLDEAMKDSLRRCGKAGKREAIRFIKDYGGAISRRALSSVNRREYA